MAKVRFIHFILLAFTWLLIACNPDPKKLNPLTRVRDPFSPIIPKGSDAPVSSAPKKAEPQASPKADVGVSAVGSKRENQKQVTSTQNPFYYVMSNSKTEIYVLGTVHFGFDIKDLPNYIVGDLKASQMVLQEYQTQKDRPESKKLMVLHGQNAKKLISEGAWQNATKELFEIGDEKLQKLQPWIISSLYKQKCYENSRRITSLDVQLEEIVNQNKLNVADLDDINLELKRIAKNVSKSSTELEQSCQEINDDLDKSLKAYLSGDESEVIALNDTPVEQMEDVIFRRNRLWLAKILEATQAHQKIFVFVGVDHLLRPQGLLNLLSNEGYSLKRCNAEGC